jgi:hypothetical protein
MPAMRAEFLRLRALLARAGLLLVRVQRGGPGARGEPRAAPVRREYPGSSNAPPPAEPLPPSAGGPPENKRDGSDFSAPGLCGHARPRAGPDCGHGGRVRGPRSGGRA